MTSCTGSARGGFWGFWKKAVELRTRHRTRRVDFRGSQRPDEFVRYGRRMRWGADGKVIIERLCLSPYVKKPFKLKGNKKFRTWTKKSSSLFRVSGFLCSMYICYEHSMYVSRIHVWLCNSTTTPGPSRPGNKWQWKVLLRFPNWSLTIRYNLTSY